MYNIPLRFLIIKNTFPLIFSISILLFIIFPGNLSFAQDDLNQREKKRNELFSISSGIDYYLKTGDYNQAYSNAVEACELSEKFYGKSNIIYLMNLHKLGLVYDKMGKYKEAEKTFRLELELYEKSDTAGKSSSYMQRKSEFVQWFSTHGDEKQAKEMMEKQKSEIENAPISQKVNYISLLHYKGNDLLLTDKDKAAEIYEELFEVIETIPEKERIEGYPKMLENYAYLLFSRQDYANAEKLVLQELALIEKLNNKNSSQYALALNILAKIYTDRGDFKTAESTYEEALEYYNNSFDTNNPAYAEALCGLADIYTLSGSNYSKAKKLYLSGASIIKNNYGVQNSAYALCQKKLGDLDLKLKRYDSAIGYYMGTLDFLKHHFNEDHQDYQSIQRNIALCHFYSGNHEDALSELEKINKNQDKMIENILALSDENEKMAYIERINLSLDISLYLELSGKKPEKKEYILDLILRRKGIVLDSIAKRNENLINNLTPDLASVLKQLIAARSEYAKKSIESSQGKSEEDLKIKEERINYLIKRIEELDEKLNKASSAYKNESLSRFADSKSIYSCLNKDECLIEFYKFYRYTSQNDKNEKDEYIAIILKGKQNPEISLITLGDAKQIDDRINDLLIKISNMESIEVINSELYKILWLPIRNELKGIKSIIICPDGQINLMPFDCLSDSDGKYLIERYNINFIPSGRDLIKYKTQWQNRDNKVVVFGNPDFNFLPAGREQPDSRNITNLNNKDGIFTSLEYTQKEVEEISNIFGERKIVKYTAGEALEEKVKLLNSPGALHFATHGFFLTETGWRDIIKNEKEKPEPILITRSPFGSFSAQQKLENPMLRSGIALTGANCILNGDKIPAGADDGILTAEEVSQINLADTYLVVLSACSTGKGEIKAGEGVMGLRRAFICAGARSMIISLWDVPDKETLELMKLLYTNLKSGKPKAYSLRMAKLNMIDSLKKENKTPHPLLWGAFVLSGEQ